MGVKGGHVHLRCNFPAVFNFGDSNSDTRGRPATINEGGETSFGNSSGRVCDGHLIIDFMSKCVFSLPKLT